MRNSRIMAAMSYASVTRGMVRLVHRWTGPKRALAWVGAAVVLAVAYLLLVPLTVLRGIGAAFAADGRNQIAMTRALTAGARGRPSVAHRSGPPQW
jgi:type II secretory pathway component PulM